MSSQAKPIGVQSSCLSSQNEHSKQVVHRDKASSKISHFKMFILVHLCSLLSFVPLMSASSLVSDLVVNVGDNVLLDCSTISNESSTFNILHQHQQSHNHIWCRFELDNIDNNTGNMTKHNKKCFMGEAYFIASEDRVSSIVYQCHQTKVNDVQHFEPKRASLVKVFRLHVDQFSSVLHKREAPIVQQPELNAKSFRSRFYGCRAPRCKPYASVVSAQCSRIELSIKYPRSQYGYNASIDYWGTVLCNDHVTGYQLWLIGYGIVKKFMPDDRIILDDLVPGKRYCFNGWAYNACGSGPVFTLEGVCAKNTDNCLGGFDEHCELDVDYSY